MLISNWRQAGRWWSVRVSALGSILYAAMTLMPDQLLTLWNMMPTEIRDNVPSGGKTWIGLILFVLVIVARIIPQRAPGERQGLWTSISGKVAPKAAGGIVGAVMAAVLIAMPLTQASEGTKLEAYQDPAKIWTICTGRTTDVKPGDRATRAQCAAWLQTELAEHMTAAATSTPVLLQNANALAAAGDFHYNAGAGWWLKSPMRAHFQAGRWTAGCDAFRGYIVKARAPRPVPRAKCAINSKGVRYCELPGLVARRVRERSMCLTGSWQ